jgi:hypothetical protein
MNLSVRRVDKGVDEVKYKSVSTTYTYTVKTALRLYVIMFL